MNHQEMIDVIQAHKEGKEIECRPKGESHWTTAYPSWQFNLCEYRIKRIRPELFECWAKVWDGGYCTFASKQDADSGSPCIPAAGRIIKLREVIE